MGNRATPVRIPDFLPEIRGRFKEVREGLGLDVRGFADGVSRAGYEVSQASVSGYEDETTIPAEYLAAVCTAYDINPAYLLWGELPEQRQTPAHLERVLEIISDVASVADEEEIARLQKIIQTMKEEDGPATLSLIIGRRLGLRDPRRRSLYSGLSSSGLETMRSPLRPTPGIPNGRRMISAMMGLQAQG